jgi:hypothetical protein
MTRWLIVPVVLLSFSCSQVTQVAPPSDTGNQKADLPDSKDTAVTDTPVPDGLTDTPSVDTAADNQTQETDGITDSQTSDTAVKDVSDSDVNVVEIIFDSSCEPNCTDKLCGPDGCGGICGYCVYPAVCDAEGQCVTVCVPDCDGKFCGNDGCGGNCGTCEEGLSCGEDGLCYEDMCVPDCGKNTCGPDGCGGDCGVCSGSKICGFFDGCPELCCGLGPCGTVDEKGECQGNTLLWCEEKVNLKEQDCSLTEDYSCQYDPVAGKYVCGETPECVPQCDNKQCGADSCGDVCGVCTSGWACELGQCKPDVGADCGTITQLGQCDGNILWFCTGGKLYQEDCSIFNDTCGFIAAEGVFGCK